jgi:hypothetical protein
MLVYVFSHKKVEEMKYLSHALEASIGQQAKTQERMLATIEKLAESLQPAVRQALSPVDQSVNSINVTSPATSATPAAAVSLESQTKDTVPTRKSHTFSGPRQISGVISELDMLTGSCKVSLQNDAQTLEHSADNQSVRITAKIVDPVIGVPNNPYAEALSNASSITFTAKAELDPEGNVVMLYITDC